MYRSIVVPYDDFVSTDFNGLVVSPYISYTMYWDPIYAILISYFLGVYVGILIGIERNSDNKFNIKPDNSLSDNIQDDPILEDPIDEDKEIKEPPIKKTRFEDIKESDDDDSDDDDSDYVPTDSESESESESDELAKIEIRDTINKLYICTDMWEDYVSFSSIYKRIQILYPNITKFMLKESMNMDPRFITGTQFNKRGYRYIMAV
jgi:hypothetical protein